VEITGVKEGDEEGDTEGAEAVVDKPRGTILDIKVGIFDGTKVGTFDGLLLGTLVGFLLGDLVGVLVTGDLDGLVDDLVVSACDLQEKQSITNKDAIASFINFYGRKFLKS
jgi:hypothetical protein